MPPPAHAHLVNARFGDFYGGMLHPLSALDYALPWLALGLLAGLQPTRIGRWMLLAFPMGIGIGVALSRLLPPPEALLLALNIVSFIVIGGLIALARPLPASLVLALGFVFGVSQGWENALAITGNTSVLLFFAGIATAGYIVVTLVTAVAAALAREDGWARIAVRAAGSWITAVGLLAIGVRLAVP